MIASAYTNVSTTHYLRAVQKAGTNEAGTVDQAMKAMPITGNMLSNPRIQDNGRVVMDLSKGPADIYKVLGTTPAAQSGCPLTAG